MKTADESGLWCAAFLFAESDRLLLQTTPHPSGLQATMRLVAAICR
ncbi:MAG TPA: hypothetical protein VGL94_11030 [Ktedonobacteraceae bacterium]